LSTATAPTPTMASLRHQLFFRLAQDRTVFKPLALAHPTLRPLRLTRETQLVIEGFPRSANTYAVVAFQQANPGVIIAHHTHSSVTVRNAARRGVPTLLISRAPADSCRSLCLRYPGLTMASALRQYIRFHERLLSVASGIYVAAFDDVVTDYGVVLDGLNSRFGTEFAAYSPTPQNEDRCYKTIEAIEREEGKGRLRENMVARPSATRFQVEVTIEGCSALLQAAEHVRDELIRR